MCIPEDNPASSVEMSSNAHFQLDYSNFTPPHKEKSSLCPSLGSIYQESNALHGTVNLPVMHTAVDGTSESVQDSPRRESSILIKSRDTYQNSSDSHNPRMVPLNNFNLHLQSHNSRHDPPKAARAVLETSPQGVKMNVELVLSPEGLNTQLATRERKRRFSSPSPVHNILASLKRKLNFMDNGMNYVRYAMVPIKLPEAAFDLHNPHENRTQ